jgi:hypothetical protein
MSVKADREDFENSGLQGALRKLVKEKNEGYVLIADGGWRGQSVAERPKVGEGAFIYFKRGEPLLRFENDGRAEVGSEFPLL